MALGLVVYRKLRRRVWFRHWFAVSQACLGLVCAVGLLAHMHLFGASMYRDHVVGTAVRMMDSFSLGLPERFAVVCAV